MSKTTAADELNWLDATAQAAIARIEKHNGELNAVVSTRFEQARREADSVADGPFRGVPMLLKDSLRHTAGDP